MIRRFAAVVLAGFVALILLLCAATIASAQTPVTQLRFSPDRFQWDTLTAQACVMGAVRDGSAVVTGYSIATDCARRIGTAERLGNRQCVEGVCARLWRFTFDAGGGAMVWIREWTRSGFIEARRWRLAFDPPGWA